MVSDDHHIHVTSSFIRMPRVCVTTTGIFRESVDCLCTGSCLITTYGIHGPCPSKAVTSFLCLLGKWASDDRETGAYECRVAPVVNL